MNDSKVFLVMCVCGLDFVFTSLERMCVYVLPGADNIVSLDKTFRYVCVCAFTKNRLLVSKECYEIDLFGGGRGVAVVYLVTKCGQTTFPNQDISIKARTYPNRHFKVWPWPKITDYFNRMLEANSTKIQANQTPSTLHFVIIERFKIEVDN